jgi:hypothetical protein
MSLAVEYVQNKTAIPVSLAKMLDQADHSCSATRIEREASAW